LRRLSIVVLLAGLLLPVSLIAQSEQNNIPLGDIARAYRQEKDQKEAPQSAQTVINNDNLDQIMQQAEKSRLKGIVGFIFDGIGKDVHVTSPDVTCSLSFSALTGPLISDPFAPRDLPRADLAKIDGPATITGDALQVTVYNGTGWQVNEITVGLTIPRPPDASAASRYGSAKLVPAAALSDAPEEKRPDLTVLYHIKGSAAPFTTAVFRQDLSATLRPGQRWSWSIVQAQGIPPKESTPASQDASPSQNTPSGQGLSANQSIPSQVDPGSLAASHH
jgi:hypothetical protein